MIGNLVRGGQILLHNFRMFRQVAGKTIFLSLLFSFIIAFAHFTAFKEQDFAEYGKLIIQYLKYLIQKLANNIASFAHSKPYMHSRFYLEFEINILVILLKKEFEIMVVSFLTFFGFISVIWTKIGAKAKEKKKMELVSKAKNVNRILLKNKILGNFSIALKKEKITDDSELYLPKNFEVNHTFVTGATNSGKTNLLHNFISQIRKKNQSAIILDQSLEMVARYYDPEHDMIFNPFDERGKSWDFLKEVANMQSLESLASTLFPQRTTDPMWDQTSRQVFIDAVSTIQDEKNSGVKELYELLMKKSVKEMYEAVKGKISCKYLDPSNEKTSISIATNTSASLRWLEHIGEANGEFFTIKDWVKNSISEKKGFLFITSTPNSRETMQPLQSMMLDFAVMTLMNLHENENRRLWFIIDELASLRKLSCMGRSLAELRKYGGCILAATQTMSQLYEIYGHHGANTMFAQFGTKFFFKNSDPSMNSLVTRTLGKSEYTSSSQTTSYGASEYREGVSIAEVQGTKELITHSDLAALGQGTCFVTMPTELIKVAKITCKKQIKPIVEKAFVEKEKATGTQKGIEKGDVK